MKARNLFYLLVILGLIVFLGLSLFLDTRIVKPVAFFVLSAFLLITVFLQRNNLIDFTFITIFIVSVYIRIVYLFLFPDQFKFDYVISFDSTMLDPVIFFSMTGLIGWNMGKLIFAKITGGSKNKHPVIKPFEDPPILYRNVFLIMNIVYLSMVLFYLVFGRSMSLNVAGVFGPRFQALFLYLLPVDYLVVFLVAGYFMLRKRRFSSTLLFFTNISCYLFYKAISGWKGAVFHVFIFFILAGLMARGGEEITFKKVTLGVFLALGLGYVFVFGPLVHGLRMSNIRGEDTMDYFFKYSGRMSILNRVNIVDSFIISMNGDTGISAGNYFLNFIDSLIPLYSGPKSFNKEFTEKYQHRKGEKVAHTGASGLLGAGNIIGGHGGVLALFLFYSLAFRFLEWMAKRFIKVPLLLYTILIYLYFTVIRTVLNGSIQPFTNLIKLSVIVAVFYFLIVMFTIAVKQIHDRNRKSIVQ